MPQYTSRNPNPMAKKNNVVVVAAFIHLRDDRSRSPRKRNQARQEGKKEKFMVETLYFKTRLFPINELGCLLAHFCPYERDLWTSWASVCCWALHFDTVAGRQVTSFADFSLSCVREVCVWFVAQYDDIKKLDLPRINEMLRFDSSGGEETGEDGRLPQQREGDYKSGLSLAKRRRIIADEEQIVQSDE
ncbi:hypothetical protein CC78DRAFT_614420 [Lojkania enalia]|uniref:Uncharacterized protein n=1 Tax=Lojkania enalia TaxID=147567 RepID=A0A9P4KFF9_9PLEO|nr:hypothetical protein CC78DRAFT_614420 [Didymosphaeria enalia]